MALDVNRCVCFDTTFVKMKAYADHTGCGMDGLQKKFGCGRSCATCVPYIRLMLETGRTQFEVDEPNQDSWTV